MDPAHRRTLKDDYTSPEGRRFVEDRAPQKIEPLLHLSDLRLLTREETDVDQQNVSIPPIWTICAACLNSGIFTVFPIDNHNL